VRAAAITLVVLAAACLPQAAAGAVAGRPSKPAAQAKAPSDPPLSTAGGADGGTDEEETAAGGSSAQADPLVSNGLGSPSCGGGIGEELSRAQRRNCETSGFIAAPAPTGDYGIDVHIDTGLLGLDSGGIWTIVQDLVVAPLWMALVWAVHAAVVMLEWCFTLDLLDSSAAIGLGSTLREMQASFTQPWLPIALACAAVLAAYHGIIRRRVAQTLGETLLMLTMMTAGLWVIADPTGSVGLIGQWADEASLGTVAVAAHGSPASAGRGLADSFSVLFASAIEAPWCYLEFGEVAWCREPSRLDPRLRAAALHIAGELEGQLSCQHRVEDLEPCSPPTGESARALEHSAELLREARTNGAIFLALPANGPARNSINEQGSLLRALCRSSEATNCHGPTAAEAEFRTGSSTLARLGGLLLIAGGLLGMLMLLGFLGLRLLLSAIFSLLYLLLAPAVVIAPAFGEGGRTLFRKWGGRLLETVVSKLVFSFLLGVMLAILGLLSSLFTLGWWTQWLLMSAFWWGAFLRRHEALGLAHSAFAGGGSPGEHASRRSLARRVGAALETPRLGVSTVRAARSRFSKRAPDVSQRRRAQVGGALAREGMDEQLERLLAQQQREATERASRAPEIQRELAAERTRLARIADARAAAEAVGDSRRVIALAQRGERLAARISRGEEALGDAQRVIRQDERARRRTGARHEPERQRMHSGFLDEQAQLPASGRAGRGGGRRDYPRLTGLAGVTQAEYEALDATRQRAVRIEIDRELALRDELQRAAGSLAEHGSPPALAKRERSSVGGQFGAAVQQGMRSRGRAMPATQHASGAWARRGAAAATRHGRGGSEQSSVMRDAFEVQARRKRQLGRDRT
jgi:hypothetical protein